MDIRNRKHDLAKSAIKLTGLEGVNLIGKRTITGVVIIIGAFWVYNSPKRVHETDCSTSPWKYMRGILQMAQWFLLLIAAVVVIDLFSGGNTRKVKTLVGGLLTQITDSLETQKPDTEMKCTGNGYTEAGMYKMAHVIKRLNKKNDGLQEQQVKLAMKNDLIGEALSQAYKQKVELEAKCDTQIEDYTYCPREGDDDLLLESVSESVESRIDRPVMYQYFVRAPVPVQPCPFLRQIVPSFPGQLKANFEKYYNGRTLNPNDPADLSETFADHPCPFLARRSNHNSNRVAEPN